MTNSTSITLSAEDGWVPMKIESEVEKPWISNISPKNAEVRVRTPDGKIHGDGFGHENDTWTTKQKRVREAVIWFVSTDSADPVTYTVTWAN